MANHFSILVLRTPWKVWKGKKITTLGVHLSVSYPFVFSYCSRGSQGKSYEVVCHSLLQWTAFCQNSPPWPVCPGWPHTAWLTVSLSETRLWCMRSVCLVFCDCGFHSVCPLMEEDKRLMEASDGRDWLRGKLGLILRGGSMLRKSLIQSSDNG